jgi:hypothetical protein
MLLFQAYYAARKQAAKQKKIQLQVPAYLCMHTTQLNHTPVVAHIEMVGVWQKILRSCWRLGVDFNTEPLPHPGAVNSRLFILGRSILRVAISRS